MRAFAAEQTRPDVPIQAPVAPWEGQPDWNDDEAIDQVLRLVADHHTALGTMIGRPSFSPTLAELRQSPLGRDLRVIANGARGEASMPAVRAASTRVADVLLRPLAADDFRIPAWFWPTAIGRMVARAERTSREPGSLLSLVQAAARLDAEPDVLERWIADGAMRSIPDEDGRPLIPRNEVERRRAIRLELTVRAVPDLEFDPTEDVLVDERRLAS